MEFSCHIGAFEDLLLSQALGTIARMGFRYVDLGTGPFLDPARDASRKARRQAIDRLQEELARYHLGVADVCLWLPRISLSDSAQQRAEVQAFRAMLPIVKALGAPGITLTAGLVHAADDAEALGRTVSALRDMVSIANDADVALSIEPQVDSMAPTPEMALGIVAQVPGLQITLDWAQMCYQGIGLEAASALLPETRHVQIRQAMQGKQQVAFADGTLELDTIMRRLQAYEGFISIEMMQDGTLDPVIEAIRLRDALRDLRDAVPS